MQVPRPLCQVCVHCGRPGHLVVGNGKHARQKSSRGQSCSMFPPTDRLRFEGRRLYTKKTKAGVWASTSRAGSQGGPPHQFLAVPPWSALFGDGFACSRLRICSRLAVASEVRTDAILKLSLSEAKQKTEATSRDTPNAVSERILCSHNKDLRLQWNMPFTSAGNSPNIRGTPPFAGDVWRTICGLPIRSSGKRALLARPVQAAQG